MKVSNAINILNSGIDNKICHKDKPYYHGTNSTVPKEQAGKCGQAHSSHATSGGNEGTGLSRLWEPTTNASSGPGGGNYEKTSTEKMGNHTSAKISKDTAALTREEKGVVVILARRLVAALPSGLTHAPWMLFSDM